MLKFISLLAFLIFSTSVYAKECEWCVGSNIKIIDEVKKLAKKEPAEILKSIRGSGICIKILRSHRKTPKTIFTWGSIETPKGDLSEITKQKALMGKTLCKGETEFSRDCMTIAIAEDAPLSTLFHEYLHANQIEKDQAWCALSKKLWTSPASSDDEKAIREKEWDVHKALWENRNDLGIAIEDKVTIADETLAEAKLRTPYDKDAAKYVKDQKIEEELSSLIPQYLKILKGQ